MVISLNGAVTMVVVVVKSYEEREYTMACSNRSAWAMQGLLYLAAGSCGHYQLG
jgi:hypothetical protein